MYQRIVVKIGTSVLTGGTRYLDRPHMVELSRQFAALYSQQRDCYLFFGRYSLWQGTTGFSRPFIHIEQQTNAGRCRSKPADADVGTIF
jgi:hypothetical protein